MNRSSGNEYFDPFYFDRTFCANGLNCFRHDTCDRYLTAGERLAAGNRLLSFAAFYKGEPECEHYSKRTIKMKKTTFSNKDKAWLKGKNFVEATETTGAGTNAFWRIDLQSGDDVDWTYEITVLVFFDAISKKLTAKVMLTLDNDNGGGADVWCLREGATAEGAVTAACDGLLEIVPVVDIKSLLKIA